MAISDNLVFLNEKVEALIEKAQNSGGESNIVKGSFSVSEDSIEYSVTDLGFNPMFLIVLAEGQVPNLTWGGCTKGSDQLSLFSDAYTSGGSSITVTRRSNAGDVILNDNGFTIKALSFSGYQTYIRAGLVYNYWAVKEL